MVKVDTDLFEKIWGSIADQFSYKTYDGKRGMILEIKPELPYTRSEAQDVVRKEFVISKNKWLDASEEEREKYRDYALRHNLTLYQAWMANEINVEFGVSDKEAILTGKGIENDVLPQTDQIIRYYCMEEGSGETLKDYAESQDGTIEGASWVNGYDGLGGLDYNGSSDYVDIPNPDVLERFTILILSKHRAPNDGDNDTDIRFMNGHSSFLRDGGNGKEEAWVYDGDWISVSFSVSDWGYNLFHIKAESGNTLYGGVNGENKASTSIGSLTNEGSKNHALGANEPEGGQYYLDGVISLALIWNVELSEPEIKDVAEKLELV